jgi:hypothetical protein
MQSPPTRTRIRFDWRIAGVLTNATSVTLASPDGRFGIRRMDNLAVVLPAGIAVPNVATGMYALPNGLQDPALGLVYEAIFQVVYTPAGSTTSETRYFRRIFRGATATATSASSADMVELLKTALKENPGALVSVTVDGQTTTWDRKDAIDELRFWERRAAREQGRRPLVAQIGMDF